MRVFIAVSGIVAVVGTCGGAVLDEDVWPEVKPEFFGPRPEAQKYPPVPGPQTLVSGGADRDKVVAGTILKISFVFSGKRPEKPFEGLFTLTWGVGGHECWNERMVFSGRNVVAVGEDKWQLAFDFETPLYFNSGDYGFRLVVPAGGLPAAGGRFALTRVRAAPGWEKPVTSCIRDVNGSPEFFVNGKPFYPLWGTVRGEARPEGRDQMRHSGMPLNLLNVWSSSYGWEREDGKVFTPTLDAIAEQHRRANPNPYFIWTLTVYPPLSWKTKRTDQLSADEKGERGNYWPVDYSFSSRPALDIMREGVRQAIEYLESSPYANRILGYRVTSADGPEWLGFPPKENRVYDFSKPNVEAFRKWAGVRYPQLEDPRPTTWEERTALDNGGDLVWDQSKHLMSVAYNEFHGEAIANACIEMCAQAKRSSGGRKVVGTYFGYTYYLNQGGSLMWNHYSLKKVFESKTVDFFCSPQSYIARNLGCPFTEMKPYGSIAANGFMSACENDMRTCNGYATPYGYYQTVTKWHSLMIMRRDLASELCRRHPVYTYPIHSGTDYDFPAMADLGRTLGIAGQYLLDHGAPRRKAEIAYVLGEKSITSMPINRRMEYPDEVEQLYATNGTVITRTPGCRLFDGDVHRDALIRWARCGAPVDWLLAEDLKDHPGDYKLYVFAHQFKYDDDLKRAVDGIRARGATILWHYAPGWSKGADSSLDYMRELTGIEFARVGSAVSAGVKMKTDGRFVGVREKVSPMFYPVNPEKVIGVYESGEPGIATFKQGNGRTIFSGPWRLDLKLMKSIVASAGVHAYVDSTDPIEANEKLFMLHARFAGRKSVRLPRRTDVLDVFEKRIVARDVDEFAFDAPLHSTHLFYYADDADELLAALSPKETK